MLNDAPFLAGHSTKPLIEDKSAIADELDLILLWFRDVLILKASQKADELVYKGELSELQLNDAPFLAGHSTNGAF